jgi:hypothetical protein
MRLLSAVAVMALGTCAFADRMNKCAMIPKSGRRKRTQPKQIQRGTAAPLAIDFLQSERAQLMTVFADGKTSTQLISDNLQMLGKFGEVTGEQLIGQVFRQNKESIKQTIKTLAATVKADMGEEMFALYRDNSQRFAKLVRDVTANKPIIEKLEAQLYAVDDIRAVAMKYMDESSEVYKQFLDAHLEQFLPILKSLTDEMTKFHDSMVKDLSAVFQSNKRKSGYRQLVNELPRVYQFFNDNIDFIEMQNVDKDLAEGVAQEILKTLAEQSGDKAVVDMIQRNMKFVKTLMMDRAQKQQEQKVVEKVMGKNKELKKNVANEAEFNRLVEEAKAEGKQMTNEMKAKMWDQAKQNVQKKQKEQIGDQSETYDKTKHNVKKGLTRYEHLSALMGLMPDELEQSIAEMVKESCPELDLIQVDTAEMKAIIEEQPENFIDQLIRELHDVCDMFGLIDESKVVTKVINGVEVQIYAADWAQGEKKQW